MNLLKRIGFTTILTASLTACAQDYSELREKIDNEFREGVKQYLEYKDMAVREIEKESAEKIEKEKGDLLEKTYEIDFEDLEEKDDKDEFFKGSKEEGYGYFDESFPFKLRDIGLHKGLKVTAFDNWSGLTPSFDFHFYNLYQEEEKGKKAPSMAFDTHYNFNLFGNSIKSVFRSDFKDFSREQKTIYTAGFNIPINFLSYRAFRTGVNYSLNDFLGERMDAATITNSWQPFNKIPFNLNSYSILSEDGFAWNLRGDVSFEF